MNIKIVLSADDYDDEDAQELMNNVEGMIEIATKNHLHHILEEEVERALPKRTELENKIKLAIEDRRAWVERMIESLIVSHTNKLTRDALNFKLHDITKDYIAKFSEAERQDLLERVKYALDLLNASGA